MRKHLNTALLAGLALGTTTFAGETDKKVVAPLTPLDDSWRFSLSMPAWVTWLTGDSTLNGQTTHIDLGPGDIIPRIDMAADVRMEAHKGRFSVMGEFLYLSLSDGVGTNTVVKKLDFQVDQTMADVGVAWRIVETPRGYVDVTAGVRYTNFYQQVTLQPNDERIGAVAGKLAVAGTAVKIARELRALEGSNPTVPIAPLDAGAIRGIVGAIQGVKGSTATRKDRIASILHNALDRRVSRLDDWWDPYVGVRGRYNLSDKYYLSGKADIGGFGAGSDLSWQAEVAFGTMVTQNIFSEVGYRALGVDYNHDGLHMDTVTHGVQLTLGINF